jgi:hypothetical protein
VRASPQAAFASPQAQEKQPCLQLSPVFDEVQSPGRAEQLAKPMPALSPEFARARRALRDTAGKDGPTASAQDALATAAVLRQILATPTLTEPAAETVEQSVVQYYSTGTGTSTSSTLAIISLSRRSQKLRVLPILGDVVLVCALSTSNIYASPHASNVQ